MPLIASPRLLPLVASLSCLTLVAASNGVAPPAERLRAAIIVFTGLAGWWTLSCLRRGPALLLFALPGIAALISPLLANPWPENTRAGVLVMMLPMALGGAFDAASSMARRCFLAMSSIVALGAIVATGSRGGVLASAVAICVGFIAASARPRRIGKALLLLVTTALVATATHDVGSSARGQSGDGSNRVAGIQAMAHELLLENDAEGLSLDEALTGRPAIWQRSLWLIQDTPSTGLGLAGFGPSLACCYPGTPEVDHAHQAVLQIAHDFGLPGVLMFALVLITTVARLLDLHSHDRPWAASLLAAIAAALSFGVADCLPLWTPGSLALWALLGLAWQQPPSPPAPARRKAATLVFSAMLMLMLAWAVAARLLPSTTPGSTAAVDALGSIASEAQAKERRATSQVLEAAAEKRPQLLWLAGLAQPDLAARHALWLDLLDSADDRLALVKAASASDPELAAAAVKRWPLNADAWHWHASQAPNADKATSRLRAALGLRPNDGLGWLELGSLLAPTHPDGALFAWTRACEHGDPGANGCWRAGQLAESLGDLDAAERLYRRSRWPQAKRRADSLH